VNGEHRRFSPGAVDYDGTMAANFSGGRALSFETAEIWRSAIEPFLKTTQAALILDLGAGTGRFSSLLADWFEAEVIAIEPARSMLAVAAKGELSPRVAYVAGTAESIPLRDNTCDLAWLSQVFHHIRDRRACARELHRVLRRDGYVFIRGTFGDRLDGFPTLARFFPSTRLVCEDLPTTKHAAAIFQAEGFTLEGDSRIQQRTCRSLKEFGERTRLRADTALALISDEEFERGLAALKDAAVLEREPTPVLEILDLLVFRAAV
jgi:ubiquinone/menaquinone biosynthesis C-methylase UbiE